MNQEIRFTGRLLETPSTTMRCGDAAIAVVHKFEIVKVLKGKLDEPLVKLIIPCPELLGEGFFVKGGQYRVTAARDLSEAEGYAVVDEYEKEQLPLLWAIKVDKSK